ncbi:hypothetical protein DD829_13950 [Chryseobacterium sp. HMWF035]|nr:hypothetical protein DBR25_05535 [Chryseobacterium sp. HMWF001]PVV55569.1 hypothetical protein DD829_13950 [Chryseobacterium sp. HMWF035]
MFFNLKTGYGGEGLLWSNESLLISIQVKNQYRDPKYKSQCEMKRSYMKNIFTDPRSLIPIGLRYKILFKVIEIL